MNRYIQAVFIIFFINSSAFCQEQDSVAVHTRIDSIYETADQNLGFSDAAVISDSTVVSDSIVPVEVRSASKALMFGLVLPGLGQAYNRKYWKMPIVWAAVGVAGYAIVSNTKQYKQSSANYALEPSDINERYLQYWRRNMELSYIAMIAIYTLQAVDAYVDALLFSWDVNQNLSMRVSPSLQPLMVPSSTGHSYGLTCSFKIGGR